MNSFHCKRVRRGKAMYLIAEGRIEEVTVRRTHISTHTQHKRRTHLEVILDPME